MTSQLGREESEDQLHRHPIPGGFAGVASDASDLREFAMRAVQESGTPGFLIRMTTPGSGKLKLLSYRDITLIESQRR
jgi:hypothetical protein